MFVAIALLISHHAHGTDSTRHADSTRTRPATSVAAEVATSARRSAARTRASAIGIADSLVLQKAQHRLTLFAQGRPLRTYYVALGRSPLGRKTRRGDGRTPEGLYYIDSHNPNSQYHLSLHISYPNTADRARARRAGVVPGGDIMIHGLPDRFASVGALHRQQDWTEGCVAVTDAEIEEIFNAVPDGTPILIVPE